MDWIAAIIAYLKAEFNKGRNKGIEHREKIKKLVIPQSEKLYSLDDNTEVRIDNKGMVFLTKEHRR